MCLCGRRRLSHLTGGRDVRGAAQPESRSSVRPDTDSVQEWPRRSARHCARVCASVCVFAIMCVESCTDLTPLHSCTFASLFPALLSALDHSSNALAEAQVVPQNRVALDMVAGASVSDATSGNTEATPRPSTAPAAAAAVAAATAEH